MTNTRRIYIISAPLCALLLLLTACQTPAEKKPPPLAVDIFNPERQAQLCAQIDVNWNVDWGQVIEALQVLVKHQANCTPDQPSEGKLYAAYYNYGALLETQGDTEAALPLFYAALELKPDGREARVALFRLQAPSPTPPPLPSCDPLTLRNNATLPPYQVSATASFVTVEGRGFAAEGIAFVPRGVNYFPLRFPWRRFLTQADLDSIRSELRLIREAGFNSLRIFLWNEALFECPANGAVPNPEAFGRLDAVLHEAATLGFRLIVTLNDLPDLTLYPLYTNPDYIQQQTAFIVERYKDEAAIMAWDMRNEGDIDYRGNETLPKDMVLTWLGQTLILIRGIDTQHLITAGWLQDELSTAPYVDFLSFHYWSSPDALEDRLKDTLAQTEKPVVMEEFGYSTRGDFSPETQRDFLNNTIKLAENMGVAGWLIWTAFDFPTDATCIPPACPSEDNAQHHFGLWQTDYTPKPAVETLGEMLR